MIIVLAMDRCGSSLLMQTLNHLGSNISGKKYQDGTNENSSYNQAINPKGFYEDKNIFLQGLNAEHFSQSINFDNEAHKISIKTLTGSNESDCQSWIEHQKNIQVIFVPFRRPLEQAHSYYNLVQARNKKPNEFVFITNYLKHYQRSYQRLTQLLSGPLFMLRDKVQFMHYQEAFDNPRGYMENISRALPAPVDKEKVEEAIANIEMDLYRFKINDLPLDHQVWEEKIGAMQSYRVLCDFYYGKT